MKLSIKRLDLLNPTAPGNKYFKLKYNLLKAKELGCEVIVTPGGPFSNHLHATAHTCFTNGLRSVGLVHGTRPEQLSPTLKDCEEWGMELHFIERALYAERDTEGFKHWVHEQYPLAYYIPEGGKNYLGINGCMEILDDGDKANEHLTVGVGTGATLCGVLLSAQSNNKIHAFPALKDSQLPKNIENMLYWFLMDRELAQELCARVVWHWDYTFGGFAKMPPELESFIEQNADEGLPLDRVYTSKMMYGLKDLAAKGYFSPDDTVLAIHTGGLQGNRPLGNY